MDLQKMTGGFLIYFEVTPRIMASGGIVAAVLGTSIALSQNRRDSILSVVVGAAVLLAVQTLLGGAFGAMGAAFNALN